MEENKKENASAYLRKSQDDKEGTDSSISNQEKLAKEYAKWHNLNLPDENIFIDKNISGSDRERKAFGQMIRRAIAGEFKIIIVKDQDRFARDSAFFSDTLTDLEAYGVKVFSIMKNDYLSASDLGDVVTSVVNSNDIIKGRAKTKVLFQQKQNESLPPFISSFGYKFSKTKPKNWIIDKKQSEIVKIVCFDAISGVNYKETLEKLKINKSLYYRILKNASKGVYSGIITYKRKIKDSKGNSVRLEEVSYMGTYEHILDAETVCQICALAKFKKSCQNSP